MLFFYAGRKKERFYFISPPILDAFVTRKFVLVQLQMQLIKTYIAQFSMQHDQMRFTVS